MQTELEQWIAAHSFYRRLSRGGERLKYGDVVAVEDLRAFFAGKVLCNAEPVACERCKGQGAVMDTIRLPVGGTVQSVADCDACNATGTLYAPASLAGNADIGKEGA